VISGLVNCVDVVKQATVPPQLPGVLLVVESHVWVVRMRDAMRLWGKLWALNKQG